LSNGAYKCVCTAKGLYKLRRGPKLEGCAFANFGNSRETEGKPSQKERKMGGKKEDAV